MARKQAVVRQLVFWQLVVLSYYFTKFHDFSTIIQVFSDSMIFPCIPLKHKCFKFHSDMGHCYYFFFTFLTWGKQTWYWGNVTIFDWEWDRNSAPRDGQKIPYELAQNKITVREYVQKAQIIAT